MTHTILIVDDEERLLDVLGGMLESLGYGIVQASSGASALVALEREPVDLVLTDLRMPGVSGRELLAEIRRAHPILPVVVMTAFTTLREAVQLIKGGAFDYIGKPIELDELEATVGNALNLHDALRDNDRLRRELVGRYSIDGMVGNSPAMQEVMKLVTEVASSRTTVLVTGESGTGKEVVARAIHFNGPRQRKPFVAVNAAAIPEQLLESEFFGHVKGAFTGATANRVGRFAQADGGTLFLDEIGDMPLSLQAKILRVLQERQFEPVGSPQTRNVDVRIVAATNRDLKAMVADGRFREDLFYRLAVFPIALPPLRDRRGDIPLLLQRFTAEIGLQVGRRGVGFSPAATEHLTDYGWPGNIRELQNCVERSLITSKGATIEVEDLPPYVADRPAATLEETRPVFPIDLDAAVDAFERGRILAALRETNGVQVEAARLLGINERSLWHRIKKHGVVVSKTVAA
ncbi:sigma-54 dependent transcriptional regulator [Aureimonas sp. AU4]|uniref:sigma-54-dependent transcriptional regulator n=1 Tax=Aureimonas sp. AU4 TaxID=1638163 RepID=UPI000706A312|nr:sigma-54 dependent transcriptional regulator [Aureimonas sp. AU4]BAT30629.1 acetoacetate metabolism regulatory protein AtoC [Aureimonas sp. AU4]